MTDQKFTRLPLIEWQYVLQLYLGRIVVAAAAMMVVVLAIDLATNFDRISGLTDPTLPPAGFGRWLSYGVLRAAYNLPAVLPIAAAIGVVATEFKLAMTQERTAIFDTGRSRLWSMLPALVAGLVIGLASYGAMTHLRPLSVQIQGEYGMRSFGARYSRADTALRWIATDRAVMRGWLTFGKSGPKFGKITVFSLDADHRLTAVTRATAGKVSGDRIILSRPDTWPDNQSVDSVAINPVWLDHLGIEPRFLPDQALRAIAQDGAHLADRTPFVAAMIDRQASWAKPVALCLLAAGLSLVWMRPRLQMRVPIAIAAACYGFYALGDGLATLAEYGAINPVVAAWGPTLVTIIAIISALAIAEGRINRLIAAGQ